MSVPLYTIALCTIAVVLVVALFHGWG